MSLNKLAMAMGEVIICPESERIFEGQDDYLNASLFVE